MSRALLLGGAALAGVVLLASRSSAAIVTPTPPPSLPPDSLPPSDDGRVGLGDLARPERCGRILTAVYKGLARPIAWWAVDCSRGPTVCTVYVSADAVSLPIRAYIPAAKVLAELDAAHAAKGHAILMKHLGNYAGGTFEGDVRVTVRHPIAEAIAEHLGAYLPTTRIADRAWQQAAAKIAPQNQQPDASMARTFRMIAHSLTVDQARSSIPYGLVRPVGKDWATSNLVQKHKAVNFGWHTPGASYKSPGGLPVLQPVSDHHDDGHVDYSQVVTLVRADCLVDGQARDIAEVMQHPTLHKLVSDEGPIKHVRHPMLVG